MTVAIPEIHVGHSVRCESLAVFPLFSDSDSGVEYRLSEDALADESVLAEEVSTDGSVPDLLVENKGDVRVLFLEGEELIGAKQNRILNTSVLVAAHSKIKIPVSCVERGRWGYKSRYFGSSGSYSPAKLRRALKGSVSRSVKGKRGHKSDQGEIWSHVASMHASLNVESQTEAMSDAFDSYRERIASFQEQVRYVEGAVGFAVAIADRIVSLDIFDKPATCKKVWGKLLSGVVFDTIEAGETDKTVSKADVERLLATANALHWEPTQAVGEGDEFRAESEQGDHASALSFEQTVVHGSLVVSD